MAEKVPVFQAPEKALEIPTQGLSALETAGRMMGRLGAEAAAQQRAGGQAVETGLNQVAKGVEAFGAKIQSHDNLADISAGANTYAQAQLALTQQWKATLLQNPNDPNLAQNFLENNVQPALEGIADGFQTEAGRKFASSHNNQMLEHWSGVLAAGQAQASGQAVQGNLNSAFSALTNSVATDPTHLPMALSQVTTNSNAAASGGTLSPEQAAHVTGPGSIAQQRELITVAAKSIIDKTPEADMSGFFQTYGDRLGGENVATLTKYQESMKKTSVVQQKANDKQAELTAQTTADAHAQQLYPQLFGSLQTGSHQLPGDTISQVMQSKDLTDKTKTAIVGAYARITADTAAKSTSPGLLDGAVSGMLQPANSPHHATATNLIGAVAEGTLAPGDANMLMTMSPGALAGLHDTLNYGRSALAPMDPGSGKIDPVRFAQYGQFQRWALEQASKGSLPPLDQLPNVAASFKGYTLTNGTLSWGGRPIEIPGAPRKPIQEFFSGMFGGKH